MYCDIDRIQKIPLEVMKEEFLYCSSRHHTNSHYNLTEFYSLDTSIFTCLTESQIEELEAMYKERKEAEKEKKEEKWKCSFLEWSGKGKHKRAKRVEGTGTVKGMWFLLPDGRKKKTTATGFEFLVKL